MKNILLVLICILGVNLASKAQEINWRSWDIYPKNLVSLQLGADYGTAYGLAYGRKFSKKSPIVVGAEVSFPFGNRIFDDWKIKVNLQHEIWHKNHFSLSLKPEWVMRRYDSEAARLYNMGGEITANFGYLRPKWGISSEISYAKPLFTRIHHHILKDYYPEISDGWYGSTGGNFKLGIKGNYSYKTWGIFLKTGKIYGQNFRDNPTLPFYFEVSLLKYL